MKNFVTGSKGAEEWIGVVFVLAGQSGARQFIDPNMRVYRAKRAEGDGVTYTWVPKHTVWVPK